MSTKTETLKVNPESGKPATQHEGHREMICTRSLDHIPEDLLRPRHLSTSARLKLCFRKLLNKLTDTLLLICIMLYLIKRATYSRLHKCWSKCRALSRFIRWKLCRMVEYIRTWIARVLKCVRNWAIKVLEQVFCRLAEVRVPIILGLLCLFLYQPIEELAIKRLVAPVLAHFNTGWLSSIVALVLAVILALRFIQLALRRYIVGGKVVLSAFFILLGYRYYRCARPDFEFYGLFDKACPIAFADLIPLACFLTILLWAWAYCNTKRQARQKEQAAESIEGFLTDHPLTEEEEALSGWTSQAQTLTQKLLATDTTHAAFSLGIVASWGEGKSSFMGIMQRYLQQAYREVIIMRFNPWLYDKEAQLTKVFFEELRRTLAPYSSKLSKSIDNYADLLLAVDSSWLKLAHELLRLSQRSTTEQFDKLSRDIKELGRKVVIFIDDVDRLTREELMELFNLVRNSSNLPCLYFVLAYDKSYVLKTLQSDGEHMSRYPEKILQEEYPLPKLTPDKMRAVLVQCLKETPLGKELLDELKGEGVNLPYHLTTIRMVKRMVNAFGARYEQLHNAGVAPFDLFIFELIYYVYPCVYDYLKEMYQAHTNDRKRKTPSIWDTGDSRVFLRQGWRQILSQNLFERGLCKYSSLDQQYIEILINTLWRSNRIRRAPQINDLLSLGRYFYRSPLAQDILEVDFLSFLGLDRKGKAAWMDQQTFLSSQESFIHLLKDHLGTRRDYAEEIIWTMLYWNSIRSSSWSGEFRRPHKGYLFLGEDIERSVSESRQDLLPQLKVALETFFNDASLIPGLWIYITSWLAQSPPTSVLFTQDELFEKLTLLFKKIARGNNVSVLYSYWVSLKPVSKPDLHTHIEELTTIMREQAQRDLSSFLPCVVIQCWPPYGRLAYTLRPIPWESRQELRQILEDSKIGEEDLRKRYLNFLKKLGYKKHVHLTEEEVP